MAYCTVQDVEAQNSQREPYSNDTRPTRVQVSDFIDDVAGEMDSILAAQGQAVPVTEPPSFVSMLRRLNALGAASYAEEGMYPESDGETMATRLYKRYQDGLARLVDGSAIPPAAPSATATRVRATSYGIDNPASDGNAPAPVFQITDRF